MIEEFYGFSAPPFSLSPDARFFYDSPGHRQALAYLQFGLQQGEGFIVITGEIGAGKSTLINRLLDELDRNSTEVAYITTSNVDPDDVLRLICSQFHVTPQAGDKASLLRAVETYLIHQRRLGRRALVIVDEAQNLPMRTIEELRMLSNISVDGVSAIQCFLVGQPQFKAILADPDMEQLRQRVIASYHLDKLNQAETQRYIDHRMQVVGWTGRPQFTDDAVAAIYHATNGVPRRINNACSRLLMHGAFEGLDVIDEAAARQILSEMGTEVAESAASDSAKQDDGAPAAGATAAAPAPQDTMTELNARLTHLERRLSGLERSQEFISKSLAALRSLEGRIETLETNGTDGSGETPDLSGLRLDIGDCVRQIAALDQRLTETQAAPSALAPDLTPLEARLAGLEAVLQDSAGAADPATAATLTRIGNDLRAQAEILQDVMTVTMSLLGPSAGGEIVTPAPYTN